jgi:cardiolipin synthase
MSALIAPPFRLLATGDEAFAAMLDAIAAARVSIQFEMYIWGDDEVGRRFLVALLEARERGVSVQLLVDAWGSFELNRDFFGILERAGAQVRWFNPIDLRRFAFRDHRKVLVCDDHSAFIGGFNVAREYAGDGRARGWCDIGLALTGPVVRQLSAAFGELFAIAALRHRLLTPLRRSRVKRRQPGDDWELLLSGPGRGRNPIKAALLNDFKSARHSIRIASAYFLPPLKLRRALDAAARRGVRVQLLLAGQSDVPISQQATRSLYRRFLRAGIEVHEYQPQILHAKLVIADGAVYAGSSNLDPRSLDFNYELLVRARQPQLTAAADALFDRWLADSRRIELAAWTRECSFCERLRQRWAYFVVAQVDQFVSRRQLKRLR